MVGDPVALNRASLNLWGNKKRISKLAEFLNPDRDWKTFAENGGLITPSSRRLILRRYPGTVTKTASCGSNDCSSQNISGLIQRPHTKKVDRLAHRPSTCRTSGQHRTRSLRNLKQRLNEHRTKVRRLRAEGYSYRTIADKIGLSVGAVQRPHPNWKEKYPRNDELGHLLCVAAVALRLLSAPRTIHWRRARNIVTCSSHSQEKRSVSHCSTAMSPFYTGRDGLVHIILRPVICDQRNDSSEAERCEFG